MVSRYRPLDDQHVAAPIQTERSVKIFLSKRKKKKAVTNLKILLENRTVPTMDSACLLLATQGIRTGVCVDYISTFAVPTGYESQSARFFKNGRQVLSILPI